MNSPDLRLKSADDIKRIREAGRLAAEIFALIGKTDLPGISTWEMDSVIDEQILKRRARSAFKTHSRYGFASCISINDEAAHGVPSKKRLIQKGDLVSIDVGLAYKGYFCDMCKTFVAGAPEISLVAAAREGLAAGIGVMVPHSPMAEIGRVIESSVTGCGFAVVQQLSGHGTGFALHEPPKLPHYATSSLSMKLVEGMVLAVEPCVSAGTTRLAADKNSWTLRTADGSLTAQFEHTVAVTSAGPVVLTEL